MSDFDKKQFSVREMQWHKRGMAEVVVAAMDKYFQHVFENYRNPKNKEVQRKLAPLGSLFLADLRGALIPKAGKKARKNG